MKNQSLAKTSSQKGKFEAGFALIATISVMVLLVMVALAMLTLSTSEMRSSQSSDNMEQAKANARLALMQAIAQLQAAAGPDQRVTAAADILGSAADGRAYWTGVWNTSEYTPKEPNDKEFVTWLVSSPDTSVIAQEDGVQSSAGADEVTIFEGLTDSDSVIVPKIDVNDGSDVSGAYAYWIADEGIKADLGWNEMESGNNERDQAARLASAPGVDYGVFGGPFEGNVSYPLELNGGNTWLENMDKAVSIATSPLVVGSTSSQTAWLQENRHHITVGSLGVMSDTKKGGLRRDLSLAFEMDGEADINASEQPTKFNQQVGEFVGGSDKLASTEQAPGMGSVRERYLYRETRNSGGDFSDEITRSQAVMRGPTWWALRDYYNLYKRLRGGNNNYTLQARSYYPNRTEAGGSLADMLDTSNRYGDYWDLDQRVPVQGLFAGNNVYLHRPATSNYAPVNLGVTTLISLMTTNYNATNDTVDLAITLDPIFYFWNPYNRSIEVESIAVYLETGIPGSIDINITDGSNSDSYRVTLADLLDDNLVNYDSSTNNREWGSSYSFLIRDPNGGNIILAPGEVVAASPAASGTGLSYLGYDSLDNNSGLLFTEINKQTITLNENDQTLINVGYTDSAGGGQNASRFFIETNIPPQGTTAADLAATDLILGEQTQSSHMQTSKTRSEHIIENGSVFNPGSEPTAASLLDSKQQFGLFTYLMKPANWSGNGANPVEVFSRFNPAPMIISKDYWAAAGPNQVFNFVSSNSANDLINSNGINFGAATRNAFWGLSYDSSASTSVPMSNIPSGPLMSLADFAHANICIMASDPFHAIGNSWSNPVFSPLAPYGNITTGGGSTKEDFTGADLSWLCNDALFDRYFLSGIAPDFTINTNGYSDAGTIRERLEAFYGSDYTDAEANPSLVPYIPTGKSSDDVIDELDPDSSNNFDGYKKMGAYSFISGSFNVNSTSVQAWSSLIRSNRGIEVAYAAGGGIDSDNDETPFPSSASPSAPGNGAANFWSGFSRLSDDQIDTLATRIVDQVRARGPFMSLSHFVNRTVGGSSVTNEHYTGALQAAIDSAGFNNSTRSGAGGVSPTYYSNAIMISDVESPGQNGQSVLNTGTGLPMDITQADILRPLAPRLSARTDSFRIRAYGEVRDSNDNIIATAMCEALVQRTPEYFEDMTTSDGNAPWDDGDTETSERDLSDINQTLGRRFQIQSFRWLNPDEI